MTLKEIFSNLFTLNISALINGKKQVQPKMCPVRIDDANLIKRAYYK